ncbi:methyltransferase [Amycolatopsis regifaucium]|uniref:Methyltransferase n=1 Tax=Amycolatopsis regifaucium TaxID=546365 RepID=A0A154MVC0_9PSEU|nr:methyltransferase [Amycolatopsis regifaucium]KZB87439.1 methyltransferase [Amycolatopsis regifaucium]OKA08278.1 methyltransferase [Amycolatopsis regifaucium]SFI05330.1 O-methyltransferase [Amycolatopsis regifaucium]
MSDDSGRVGLRALADLASPMAIRVAATLRVADHVAEGRDTAEKIASSTGTNTGAMDRLLRHLVTIGLFTRDDAGTYALTPAGEPLREDHPKSRRAWLDIAGAVGRGDLAFVELLHTVRTGQPAYVERYGTPFWEDLRSDQVLSASFDALMGHHIELDNEKIAVSYDWAKLGHVIDVGGGSGALLATLLQAHPGLRGTVVDQPGPVSGARRTFRERGVQDRASAVEGDFFEPLPSGAGGYVLSAIIHDWDDEPAVAILRRCATAAGADGVVLVLENVGTDGESPNTEMDLRMLTYIAGKERGLSELRSLAERAGLVVRGVHPVGERPTVSIVELVRG